MMIDPDACVFPMIRPGLGYKDIVYWAYITAENERPAKPPDKKRPV